MKTIFLTEHKSLCLPREDLPQSVVDQLRQKYSSQLYVKLQDTPTGDRWQLTSKGWVGYIPLTPEFSIVLHPKVPLHDLFGMLAYAYKLKSFRVLEGLIDCQTIEELYEQLAYLLAQRILDRCRQGLYQAYLPKTQQLAYLRGRVLQSIYSPGNVKLNCHYQEPTRDIKENQILAWTMLLLCRSGLCSERVWPTVRKAYHTLSGLVTMLPCSPSDCLGRQYNRLNQDYRLLHNLCRFFLENTGPSYKQGDRAMVPFLVDIERLYELFVAEWLKYHTAKSFLVKQQQRVALDKNRHFRIDLILSDPQTGAARYILDTKYKTGDKVAIGDFHQMVSYAKATKCYEAVLVYPKPLCFPLDAKNDDIRVRSLTFSLDGNLNDAGNTFLQDLQRRR
ncbi:MAG: restriction endonuclease [Hormoscilla sp. SP12CHS1]|nr:restriction endonuclease [Hormoscilla sp. SP12CHS1]